MIALSQLDGVVDGLRGSISAHGLQRQSVYISFKDLGKLGPVVADVVPVGAPLPIGAVLIGADVSVTESVKVSSASTMKTEVCLQSHGETDGAIMGFVPLSSSGPQWAAGSKPYLSRGGQQIEAIIRMPGMGFDKLTQGKFTINLFYMVPA